MADDPTRGLYGKYKVERNDGKPIEECIVLEVDDPHTWDALRTWANTVEADGYVTLAADVRKRVERRERAHTAYSNMTPLEEPR